MSNNEFEAFLPKERIDRGKITFEVPPEPLPPRQEKLPSGYDPIGEIDLRGRAFRNLAGGRIPWWIIFTGWFLFGGLALMILGLLIEAIASGASLVSMFPGIIVVGIPLLILWRGTSAKLSAGKLNRRRR